MNLGLKDFTKVPFFLFNIVGITIFKYNSEERKSFIGKLIATVLMGNTVLQVLLETVYPFMESFPTTMDVIVYACYLGYSINCILKLCAVLRGRHLLYKVMEDMVMIHPSTKSDIIAYHLREYYNPIRSCTRIFAISHFVVTTMFNAFPFYQSASDYISNGGHFERRLPFYIYNLFGDSQFAFYLLGYFVQNASAWTLIVFFSGTDLLLVTMIQIICMHLRYLSNKIENFVPTGTDDDIDQMKDFISYHQKVLSLSYKINKVFSFTILVNYIATGEVVCLTAFLVASDTGFLDLLKFISLMMISLVYVYLICHFGTKLLEVSTDISQAVFSHKWYLGNMKYKKMLPLVIRRAQKPAFLSAFKFFIVSMETFKTLISCTYQLFTLLRSSYKEL